MAYEREDLQKIDDLAIEYYNEEDTARKLVLRERIAVLFMNNLEYIVHTGELKKLSTDAKRAEIVKDVSIKFFVENLSKYNPYKKEEGIVPFMAYFYSFVHGISCKELQKYYESIKIYKNRDISEMYEVCDESEGTAVYVESNQNVNEKLALFVGCIVQFQAHKDMTKSTNQTHLDYFQSFYTGDMVYLTKGEGFLQLLMNYEQLIQKSCSTEFLDYIYKDKVRTLSEIFSGKLKYYKELKNIGIFGKSKLEKTLNLPIEQNVYATYFDVSKVAISKKVDAFKDYKRQLLGEEIGA
ncbi:MAG: hypothetical protein E7522_09505 [Ruminococcaceae bacterium]|nr:hypothetical protein [Oscillospiraceae bacterium]